MTYIAVLFSDAPRILWDEAWVHAGWVKRRLPSESTANEGIKSSLHMITGDMVSLTHILPFGSMLYIARVKKQIHDSKFDPTWMEQAVIYFGDGSSNGLHQGIYVLYQEYIIWVWKCSELMRTHCCSIRRPMLRNVREVQYDRLQDKEKPVAKRFKFQLDGFSWWSRSWHTKWVQDNSLISNVSFILVNTSEFRICRNISAKKSLQLQSTFYIIWRELLTLELDTQEMKHDCRYETKKLNVLRFVRQWFCRNHRTNCCTVCQTVILQDAKIRLVLLLDVWFWWMMVWLHCGSLLFWKKFYLALCTAMTETIAQRNLLLLSKLSICEHVCLICNADKSRTVMVVLQANTGRPVDMRRKDLNSCRHL